MTCRRKSLFDPCCIYLGLLLAGCLHTPPQANPLSADSLPTPKVVGASAVPSVQQTPGDPAGSGAGVPAGQVNPSSASSGTGVPAGQPNRHWEDLRPWVRALRPLVVALHVTMAEAEHETTYVGSGFFFRPGLILTNHHIVAGSTNAPIAGNVLEIIVHWDHRLAYTPRPARIVCANKRMDLAVLRVADPPPLPAPFSLALAAEVEIGAPVLVLGYPDMTQSMEETRKSMAAFRGWISAISPDSEEMPSRLLLDVRVFGGSSGGPVVNLLTGNVIGIVSDVLIDSEDESGSETQSVEWGSLGGAVPITEVRNFLQRHGMGE